MNITTIGIDIGKTWFHLVGCNGVGTAVFRQKLNRTKLMLFIATLPKCLVGMEACAGSQHLARVFQGYEHELRLIVPTFVKPYLKGQKSDFNDAAAIAEAVTLPTMRFVSPKSIEQLDLQAIHRIRDRLVGERTAVINQIRDFLIENGLPIKEGRPALKRDLPSILEDAENGLSDTMRQLISRLRKTGSIWKIKSRNALATLNRLYDEMTIATLLTVPGIGAIGATALIAAVSNASKFRKGRELAAWLGLVPRQHSTGGSPCRRHTSLTLTPG